MPENMLKELAGYDCTYAIEIQAEAEYQEIIEQELKLLVSDNRDVRLQTLQDFIVEHQSDNRAGFTLAYAIAAILWIFAVINQINLTVTNLLSQKQEMGTLKSIGMTNKQLKQAFMMEGLFTTLIALLITAVVGIPRRICNRYIFRKMQACLRDLYFRLLLLLFLLLLCLCLKV